MKIFFIYAFFNYKHTKGKHTRAFHQINFAAKEAFGKALGTGLLREFALCEAEALRDENGAPYFSFSGRAAALMQARGLTAHLSLTHEGGTAAAFVVLERRKASASLKEEPECSTLR